MSNATAPTPAPAEPHFRRSIGLRSAIAVNMTQICGVGPFITIPLMVSHLQGAQVVLGWVIGALLAMADGLVWAELGAAMPGAGGTYLYLRETFQYRSGKLMPFLFAWSAMIFIPMVMSTGVIGFVSYLGFLVPNLSYWPTHLIAVGVTALVIIALYRKIESIKTITAVLWVVMVLALLATIVAAYGDFHPGMAFHWNPGTGFLVGLGGGLGIAVYDYAGYNTIAYLGDELRSPGKVMPRSIIISILAMMVFYLVMNIGVLGTVNVSDIANSTSVASLVITRNWGHGAAVVVTVLILITAFASVFAGLLGGSRVPYNAARDGVFFAAFGRLHRKGAFPHVALVVFGVITAIGTFFDLSTAISLFLAVALLVQSVTQIVALTVLRRRQPTLARPYRQWLYPVPSVIALVGWLYVFYSSGLWPMVASLIWIAAGVLAFGIWARINHTWPFGPKEIREAYLSTATDEAATAAG